MVASGCGRQRAHLAGGGRLLREYPAYRFRKHDPRGAQTDYLDPTPCPEALRDHLVEVFAEPVRLRGPQRVVRVDRKVQRRKLGIRVVDAAGGHAAADQDPPHPRLLRGVEDIPGAPNVGIEDHRQRCRDGRSDGGQVDHRIVARHGPSECLQLEDVDLEVDPRRRVLVSVENVHRAPVYPRLMIAVTVLSINFVGDGLRDALDARMTL